MNRKQMGIVFSSVLVGAFMAACGGSSSSGAAATDSGWNGVFVDAGIQGVDWECGGVTGKTLAGGYFGICPIGTSVTFKIGSITLGTITETSDHIFTPQDVFGVPRTNTTDTRVTALAAALLTLDNDPAADAINVTPAAAAEFESAVNANGGSLTPANVGTINATTSAALGTTNVDTTAAAAHLAAVTLPAEPTQPGQTTGASGTN